MPMPTRNNTTTTVFPLFRPPSVPGFRRRSARIPCTPSAVPRQTFAAVATFAPTLPKLRPAETLPWILTVIFEILKRARTPTSLWLVEPEEV